MVGGVSNKHTYLLEYMNSCAGSRHEHVRLRQTSRRLGWNGNYDYFDRRACHSCVIANISCPKLGAARLRDLP